MAFQSVRGNSAALSAQVLHEIPDQVLGYMAMNRILPKQVRFNVFFAFRAPLTHLLSI